MGLAFCDGFDSYGSTSDLSKKWNAVGADWTYQSTAGVTGGGAIQATGASAITGPANSSLSYVNGTPLGFAFWFKASGTPAADTRIVYFDTNIALSVSSGGGLKRPGGANGALNVCDNNWHWIEWKMTATNNGVCKIYADGVLQINTIYTNDFVTSPATVVNLGGIASKTVTFDDFIWVDNTNPAPIQSSLPLGPRLITTLRPSGDSSVQFTPDSGATNYTQVDEAGQDGDTSYVESGTSTNVDLYNYGNLGYTPIDVTALQLNSLVKNPGAGTINYKLRCSSNGTTSDTASTAANASYAAYKTFALNQNPNTTSAWTGSTVDAALFGILVV